MQIMELRDFFENFNLFQESLENSRLIADLARKIGVTVKYPTDEEKEDIGMANAMRKGRTGEFIDTEDFLQKISR